jgi:hypothetical protein
MTRHRALRVRRPLWGLLWLLVASAQVGCEPGPWASSDAPKAARAPIEVWEIEGSVQRDHGGELVVVEAKRVQRGDLGHGLGSSLEKGGAKSHASQAGTSAVLGVTGRVAECAWRGAQRVRARCPMSRRSCLPSKSIASAAR